MWTWNPICNQDRSLRVAFFPSLLLLLLLRLFSPFCFHLFVSFSTFEVHQFSSRGGAAPAQEQSSFVRRARARTAWRLPISVNTGPRSSTLRRAGGKSADVASDREALRLWHTTRFPTVVTDCRVRVTLREEQTGDVITQAAIRQPIDESINPSVKI